LFSFCELQISPIKRGGGGGIKEGIHLYIILKCFSANMKTIYRNGKKIVFQYIESFYYFGIAAFHI